MWRWRGNWKQQQIAARLWDKLRARRCNMIFLRPPSAKDFFFILLSAISVYFLGYLLFLCFYHQSEEPIKPILLFVFGENCLWLSTLAVRAFGPREPFDQSILCLHVVDPLLCVLQAMGQVKQKFITDFSLGATSPVSSYCMETNIIRIPSFFPTVDIDSLVWLWACFPEFQGWSQRFCLHKLAKEEDEMHSFEEPV